MYSASVSNIDSAVAGTARSVCSERGSLHVLASQATKTPLESSISCVATHHEALLSIHTTEAEAQALSVTHARISLPHT